MLDTDRRSPSQLGRYAMKQHDTTRHVQFRTTDTGKRGTTLMSWSTRQRRGGSLLIHTKRYLESEPHDVVFGSSFSLRMAISALKPEQSDRYPPKNGVSNY